MPAVKRTRNVKVVLVGDMYVGKTSLTNVFMSGVFKEKYSASVGGAFSAKTIENPNMTLQIWDTAGMERFRSMLPHFMRDTHCAIIVFDVSDRETFMSVREYWIDYVQKTASEENLVKILVGNKVDMALSRTVKSSEGSNLASDYNMTYIEASAKTGQNVTKLFLTAATEISAKIPPTVKDEQSYKLEHLPSKKKIWCC